MSGFDNEVVFATNVDFTGEQDNPEPRMTVNGQLLIANGDDVDDPRILVGVLRSESAGLTVGYDAPDITLTLVGGGPGVDQIDVDASTPPGTDPVIADINGGIVLTGGQIAANSTANVIRSNSLALNTIKIEVQQSGSATTQNTDLNGVAHFDSDIFTVTNGFVSTTAGSLVQTITGGPGITITGPATDPVVNSVVYTDRAAPVSVVKNSGSFSTGTVTLTTPVTAGLVDGDVLEFIATVANVLTIQLAATQVAHIGNVASSVAGTLVSTAIGDAIKLRYQASTNDWWAISAIGNWTIT